MSEAYICAAYDRAAKSLSDLQFVLTTEEEIKQGYSEGDVIYAGKRIYSLADRRVLKSGVVVQYRLETVKAPAT